MALTLEEALKDRLLSGMHDECTWEKLLVIDKLTLARAIEIAQGEEAVNKNTEALKTMETTLNAVTNPCYRCEGMSSKMTVSFKMQIAIIMSVCKSRKMTTMSTSLWCIQQLMSNEATARYKICHHLTVSEEDHEKKVPHKVHQLRTSH